MAGEKCHLACRLHLEQGDLRRFRNLDAHAVENLGFSDELENLLVEVDVQLAVVGMSDDQRSLFADRGRAYAFGQSDGDN